MELLDSEYGKDRGPIIVDENGDVQVYKSISDAVFDMEKPDIEQGAYTVADVNGTQYILRIVGNKVTAEERPLPQSLEDTIKRHIRHTLQLLGQDFPSEASFHEITNALLARDEQHRR